MSREADFALGNRTTHNAGIEAGSRGAADQARAGHRSPLHLPRHRWPYGAAGEQLLDRARMGDAQAWDAWIAVQEREEWVNRTVDRALQVMLVLLAVPGLYLVGDQDAQLRWWGYALSLAAQPFWLAATWRARQWGMFGMALVYSVLWARGVFGFFGA